MNATRPASRPMGPRVCVVGSVNMDLVAFCSRLPRPGETVTNAKFGLHPGGKGANQALAASRLGARVSLLAAVGADTYAGGALESLREASVDLSRVVVTEEASTGVAMILVDQAGENQIVVAPGANRSLRASDVRVAGFDAVLGQLEVQDEVVVEAARQCTGIFLLNAAPARRLQRPVIERSDVIIVNESEHAALTEDLASFAQLLVVTRGAAGAEAYRGGRLLERVIPPKVSAIDTVGAGDAFCAALTVTLSMDRPLQDALRYACAAGALAASAQGAQTSLPTDAEVDFMMKGKPESLYRSRDSEDDT